MGAGGVWSNAIESGTGLPWFHCPPYEEVRECVAKVLAQWLMDDPAEALILWICSYADFGRRETGRLDGACVACSLYVLCRTRISLLFLGCRGKAGVDSGVFGRWRMIFSMLRCAKNRSTRKIPNMTPTKQRSFDMVRL